MNIDIKKITTVEDIANDTENVKYRLKECEELFVFAENRPQFVLMGFERYEELLEQIKNVGNSSNQSSYKGENEAEREDILVTLNKIGKKIFVDYYYIFKADDNPEEKLPDKFTLNSRRGRSSSARRIFRNHQNLEALEIIINSDRLDSNTIQNAEQILTEEKGKPLKTMKNICFNDDEEPSKIGRLAKNAIFKLLENEMISKEEIENMTTDNESKRIFNMNFSILKEVDDIKKMDELRKDKNNYNRYYNMTLSAYGKTYILCSQWVKDLHREPLILWLEEKVYNYFITEVNKMDSGKEFTVVSVLNVDGLWLDIRQAINGRKFGKRINIEINNGYLPNVKDTKIDQPDGRKYITL